MLDHLSPCSFKALVSSPGLVNLTVARKPQDGCLLIGDHTTGRFPIDPAVTPRALPEDVLAAIAEGGAKWKTLDLDLFELGPDALKKVLEAAPELTRLKVMLASPFKNLVSGCDP